MTTIQLVTPVAGFISIIAGFIGGAWINQRGLEKQMEAFRNEIKAELRAAIDPLRSEISALRGEMNARFNEVNNRIGAVDGRAERVERQLEALFVPKPR